MIQARPPNAVNYHCLEEPEHAARPRQTNSILVRREPHRRCLRDNSLSRVHIVTDHERNRLARARITLQTTPQHASEYKSLFWSFKQSYDLAREEPMDAWHLTLTLCS